MQFQAKGRAVVHAIDDDASMRGAVESLFDSVGLDTRTTITTSTPWSRRQRRFRPLLRRRSFPARSIAHREAGPSGLIKAHLFQRGRQGRSLRGTGTAGAL